MGHGLYFPGEGSVVQGSLLGSEPVFIDPSGVLTKGWSHLAKAGGGEGMVSQGVLELVTLEAGGTFLHDE